MATLNIKLDPVFLLVMFKKPINLDFDFQASQNLPIYAFIVSIARHPITQHVGLPLPSLILITRSTSVPI